MLKLELIFEGYEQDPKALAADVLDVIQLAVVKGKLPGANGSEWSIRLK